MADMTLVMKHLTEAGVTIQSIAEDVQVSTRTVYRWRAGSAPKPANLAALTELVRYLLGRLTSGKILGSMEQETALRAALFELDPPALSDAEFRARRGRIVAENAATAEPTPADPAVVKLVNAINARNATAAKAAIAAAERAPYRSVTRDVSPFALLPKPDAIDAAFAA